MPAAAAPAAGGACVCARPERVAVMPITDRREDSRGDEKRRATEPSICERCYPSSCGRDHWWQLAGRPPQRKLFSAGASAVYTEVPGRSTGWRVAREAHAGGVLLTTQAAFAWATGGCNRRREPRNWCSYFPCRPTAGCSRAESRCHACSAEESARCLRAHQYPWADDRANAAFPVTRDAGSPVPTPIGADWPVPEALRLEGPIARADFADAAGDRSLPAPVTMPARVGARCAMRQISPNARSRADSTTRPPGVTRA